MRRIINTNIRFDLKREDDRQAYDYLLHMDRKQFKSYTRAVVAALNDFFSRRENRASVKASRREWILSESAPSPIAEA